MSHTATTETCAIIDILDQAEAAATADEVSVNDVVCELGALSYSALLLVPALLVVTPLSGVPGLSSILGSMIALISLQMLIGRNHLWLPKWILKRKVSSRKFRDALDHLRKPAAWIDRHTHPQFTVLVSDPARRVLQFACMVCGAAMPMLEIVPFTSSLLGLAVSLFATALVTRDGLLAAVGWALIASVATIVTRMLL